MNTNEKEQSSQVDVRGKYETARKNLLLMLALTVINVILLVVGSSSMLLFSATVPYYAAVFSTVFVYPYSAVCIGVTAGSIILYLLCWIFSKKHYGWMITALVLFVLDTLALIGIYVIFQDFSGILDVIIHIWVLYYLIIGVKYGYQAKSMPEIQEIPQQPECEQEG